MLFNVRYYSEMIHPDHFKGKGLRGRWIVFLNWVRYKLEKAIHVQVCRFLGDNPAVELTKFQSMLKQLSLDLKQDELQRERTSPRTEAVLEKPPEPPQPRSLRYTMPSVQKRLEEIARGENDDTRPTRPKRLDNLIGQYGTSGPRAQRYALGRRYTVADPEGDFEPLETNDAQATPDARA